MPRSMTYDEMALGILLGPGTRKSRQIKLTAVAREARNRIEGRIRCPECGDRGPHDDNGCMGANKSYCCRKCGAHFDDVEV